MGSLPLHALCPLPIFHWYRYRCVKWGVNPPSSLLGGIGQGLGSLAYEVAGGLKDFVTSTSDGDVRGGVRALVARPGIGGSIMVQKVKDAFREEKEEGEGPRKRTHSLKDVAEQLHNGEGRAVYDFDPVQMQMEHPGSGDARGSQQQEEGEALGPEELEIDQVGLCFAVERLISCTQFILFAVWFVLIAEHKGCSALQAVV